VIDHRYRSAAIAVARRGVHLWVKNPAFFFPSLIFPLFFFTAFAGGLSNVSNVPGFDFPSGYTAWQFTFVVLQASAFGGVFTGFSIAADFESGFGRRLLLAVPHRTALVVGWAMVAMTRAVVVLAMLFTVALVTGMQVDGDGVDLFGLLGLSLLVNLAAVLFGTGIAARFRTLQSAPLMQTPVFLFLFLSPVYVPLSLIKGWLHAVASVNPATALLNATRGLISGSTSDVALGFAVAVGLVAAFLAFGVRGLRKAEAAGG
jgi:ABC-2 type transport system permease protein